MSITSTAVPSLSSFSQASRAASLPAAAAAAATAPLTRSASASKGAKNSSSPVFKQHVPPADQSSPSAQEPALNSLVNSLAALRISHQRAYQEKRKEKEREPKREMRPEKKNDSRPRAIQMSSSAGGGERKVPPPPPPRTDVMSFKLQAAEIDITSILRTNKRYPNVEILKIEAPKVKPAGMALLSQIPHLTELYLTSPDIPEEAIYALQELPRLKFLHLVQCQNLTIKKSGCLRELRALQSLELDSCSSFAPIDLERLLFNCNRLTSLKLKKMALSDRLLADSIARMRDLIILTMNNCDGFSERGLEYITRALSKLKQLYLYECAHITQQVVLNLKSKPDLRTVGFINCSQLLLREVSLLAGCAQLEEISLYGSKLITDVALLYLSMLPKLRILDVGACPNISDGGIDYICIMKVPLQKLKISHTPSMSKERLEELKKIQGLSLTLIPDAIDEFCKKSQVRKQNARNSIQNRLDGIQKNRKSLLPIARLPWEDIVRK